MLFRHQPQQQPPERRVIFINNTLETFTPTRSGALSTIIWECCRVARSRGQTPTVLTRLDSGESFSWPALHFVSPPRLPSTRGGTLLWRAERKLTGWRHLRHREYAHRVAQVIRNIGAESGPMILFNEPETAVLLRQRFPNAVIVHWFQNQLECKPSFRERFADAVNVVLGVSQFTSRWIEAYYGIAHQRVKTVYNGTDLESFYPVPRSGQEPPVIGFVGRTGIEKGPDLLLDAAIALRKRGRDFQLRLIGSNHWDRFELDDYQKRLARGAAELQAMGVRVDRPGHIGRADLPAALSKSDIHVVPARWDEPFGMTTLEGMACGLAVVASRTGGTPEVLGDAGLYFERESVEQLTDRLDCLLKMPHEMKRLGIAARVRAQQFSWDRVWDSLVACVPPA